MASCVRVLMLCASIVAVLTMRVELIRQCHWEPDLLPRQQEVASRDVIHLDGGYATCREVHNPLSSTRRVFCRGAASSADR